MAAKRKTNGHAQTSAAPAAPLNKQFAKACPYCGGSVVGAVSAEPGGGGTFGMSHAATPCPVVNAIREELERDGAEFDPTRILRAGGISL